MKIAELCYSNWADRLFHKTTARKELDELGFERVKFHYAHYYVPDDRVEEIKSVIVDLNTLYKSSLWLCWTDPEQPNEPCVRWYP